MSKRHKKEIIDPIRRWFITLGAFILAQLLFIWIDGTILEPRLNKAGDFLVDIVGDKLDWMTIYHSTFLKILTLLFVIYIICH